MKARVKATGEIIEISEDCSYLYAEYYDKSYNLNELEFLDVKEKSFPKDTPDYWTRLEYTYAGMAMQGILTNPIGFENIRVRRTNIQIETALLASEFAHALIQKLKEKEERK